MNRFFQYLLLNSSRIISVFFSAMLIIEIIMPLFDVSNLLKISISYFFWFSLGLFLGNLVTKKSISVLDNQKSIDKFFGKRNAKKNKS